MKKNNKYLLIAMIAGLFTWTGCVDDFLTQTNNTNPNQDNFIDSKEALDALTAPLYSVVWWQFNEKFYYGMGDGRANNLTAMYSNYIFPYTNITETSLTATLLDAWGSFYNVIAQSNNTINTIQNKSKGVTELQKTQSIAEARFMRGLAYWYLGSLWGKAVIYENTEALVNNFVVPPHKRSDVIEFAIRDLEFAAKNLPEEASKAGRLTKYSAFGMLSRVYLSMAGLTDSGEYTGSNLVTDYNRGTRNSYYLDLAKKAALKVAKESSYKLLDDYGDLFTYAHNNNSESLFSLQWVAGHPDAIGWGANNPQQAFFAWESMITNDGAAWGNATYASYNLVSEYDPNDRERRHATICTYGEFYPELCKAQGGYTYGVTTGGYKEKCNIKKWVNGSLADNGVNQKQSSGLMTTMLRLAEVYLNLAEATLANNASTTDETALLYFNKVRERAGMSVKPSITYEDLRYERRIELALEGQYWYDLVRRAYYKQQEVVNYMNNQDRNASYIYDETEPTQYAKKADATPGTVSVATVNSLLLPLPDTDTSKNPLLKGDPVDFTFTEAKITDLYE